MLLAVRVVPGKNVMKFIVGQKQIKLLQNIASYFSPPFGFACWANQTVLT